MSDNLPAPVQEAIAVLENPETRPEDRAAIYAVLHQIQLRVNRSLRKVKDDLIVYLETNHLREMGPLSIKATAIDVKWPVNDPENWTDITTQEMLDMFAKVAPDYIRHVPEHREVDTAALGAGVAAGDPVAKRLHAELKEHGWRTEEGRRLSLAVKEATPRKAAA